MKFNHFILIFLLIVLSCSNNISLAKKNFSGVFKNSKGDIVQLSRGSRDLEYIDFISYFNELKILSFDGKYLKDLNPLSKLINLEYLDLGIMDYVLDISFLSNLENLKDFSIIGSRITDITPIGHLVNLEELSFSSSEITDISPLANCKKLKILGLQRCYKLSDITAVGELENLEHLEITYADALVDIRPIGKLKKLKYLSLTGCKKVFNIAALQNCQLLEEMHMGQGDDLNQIYIIKNMKKLKRISGINSKSWDIVKIIRPDLHSGY